MILVVEDPYVARFLERLLVKAGYRVLPAEPGSAVGALRDGTVAVDLLLTNVPTLFVEWGGRIPLLYLAAFPDMDHISAFATSRTLHKPFQPRQLLDAVAEVLAAARR